MKNLPIFSQWRSSVGPCPSWPIRLCLDRQVDERRDGKVSSFCHCLHIENELGMYISLNSPVGIWYLVLALVILTCLNKSGW